MKFKSILRESHIPYKDAVAHLRLTLSIAEEEEVITSNAELFLG